MQAQPDYGPGLCVLGLIDAALGRKKAALEEGCRRISIEQRFTKLTCLQHHPRELPGYSGNNESPIPSSNS